jgi:hypothetical protein
VAVLVNEYSSEGMIAMVASFTRNIKCGLKKS